eukprot:TRINITY_DN43169_c0_g1_i1.p1 TRINITY_DN43169_c0_g1~~TRINITY_DN43169_c0_g1_i1.p1  ORF type:complete len:254 (+),score=50.00 TRINITY_DN43169_c0_g1_i1:203-964(+)
MVASALIAPGIGTAFKMAGTLKGFAVGSVAWSSFLGHDSHDAAGVNDHEHGSHDAHADHAEHEEHGDHAEHEEVEDHGEHDDHEQGEVEEAEGVEEPEELEIDDEEVEVRADDIQPITTGRDERQDVQGVSGDPRGVCTTESKESASIGSREAGVTSAFASRIAKVTATTALVASVASRIIESRSRDLGLKPMHNLTTDCLSGHHVNGHSELEVGADVNNSIVRHVRVSRGGSVAGVTAKRHKDCSNFLRSTH